MKASFCLIAMMLCAAGSAQAQTPPSLEGLDGFIQAEMAKEKAPGLAIAVVKDGQVIYQRGFGLRDVGRGLPVTVDTAFPIASVTKSFTVLALGSLVQEGKLEWDRPVRSFMPDFQLYDPGASERMTPRDLVSHRSGLPRHDGVWYGANQSRKQYWDALRYLQPSADMRTRFQYNNLMFVAAGYLGGQIDGSDWETLVRREVLDPLGMHGTTLDMAGLLASPQPALGYARKDSDGSVVEQPRANIDGVAPAGAINSTLADMIRYLQLHVGDGRLDDKPVFDPDLLRQMRFPLIASSQAPEDPEFSRTEYGMGLFLDNYRGYRHVYHGGNIDGFTSFLSYLPDQHVGVVMLGNLNDSRLRDIIPFHIYDQLLGLTPVDFSARLAQRKAADDAAEVKPGAAGGPAVPSLRRTGTQPGHALSEYVGQYVHPAYGTVTIGLVGGTLQLNFHGANAPLPHYHYDVFKTPAIELNPLEKTPVRFTTSFEGDVASLEIPMESTVPPIVFQRQPDPAMRDQRFLKSMTGRYALGSEQVQVALRADGVLTMDLSGDRLELSPVRGTRFALRNRYGHSIEFTRDAAGRVAGFVQHNQWADRVAERVAD